MGTGAVPCSGLVAIVAQDSVALNRDTIRPDCERKGLRAKGLTFLGSVTVPMVNREELKPLLPATFTRTTEAGYDVLTGLAHVHPIVGQLRVLILCLPELLADLETRLAAGLGVLTADEVVVRLELLLAAVRTDTHLSHARLHGIKA